VAAIPAILYFLSVWMMIFCSSRNIMLRPLDRSEYSFIFDITRTEWIVNLLRLGIPVFVMLYLIIGGYSPAIAGSSSVFALIGANLFIRSRQESFMMKAKQIFRGFRNVGFTIMPISIACAIAGMIVGSVTMTGLALKFTSLIINASQGYLFLAILLVLIASLFLGMEVPTTGSYIIVATISAAALVELGVPLLLAHLVAFWYAVDSSVTPPVCITAYAGAAVAKADPWKTGLQAWKTAKGLYIIPLLAVFTPITPLHWDQASGTEILLALLTAFLGLWAFAACVEGFFYTKLSVFRRLLWGVASGMLLLPFLTTDIIGILVFIALVGYGIHRRKIVEPSYEAAEPA
jgi:TRAP transporter 4TM/12TM fusion protein